MKHRVYRTLSMLIALALLAGLPVPVLAEDAASPSENWDYTIVQDHVPTVVSMGDSFSSGEGAWEYFSQEKPIEERVRDQDWLGHRGKTAWSGLLTFRDEDGKRVALNTLRYDQQEPREISPEDARWFFVASSGAVVADFDANQEKAYSVQVFDTPKGADSAAKYMTLSELRDYYTSSNGKMGILDRLGMWTSQKLNAHILEDSEKGSDADGLCKEKIMLPQNDIFSTMPGGGENVEYVTLTIGGNDLEFVPIIVTASADIFQDALQARLEALSRSELRKIDDLKPMGVADYARLLIAAEASRSAKLSESNGALVNKLSASVDHFFKNTRADLEKVYRKIHVEAPNAVILVAGYPQLFSGASPNLFFTEQDIRQINAKVALCNRLLAELIRQCREEGREEDRLPIYFVPVDVPGAFEGHGAYSDDPYITPVLLKVTRDIKGVVKFANAMSKARDAADWLTHPIQTAIHSMNPFLFLTQELGPQILELFMDPEEEDQVTAEEASLLDFLMVDNSQWPGYDQELVTTMKSEKAGLSKEIDNLSSFLATISGNAEITVLTDTIKGMAGDAYYCLKGVTSTSSASIHPNVKGHQVYAKCVQEYIETRVPIEVTGTVRQTDENLALSPAPSGSKVVLRLKGGPVSEGSERLSDLKQDDEVYKGAVQGEYTAAIAKDGSFKVKALSGTYELEVQDKDGNALLLYGMDGKTSVEVELMHHNSKGLDVRVMAMQEISGRVFAYDEDGNPMDIDCALYPVEMNFANVGMNDTRDGVRMPGGEVVENQAHDAASIVGSFALESIPKKGAEYKLRVPIGTTGIALWTPLTGVSLPLYDNDTGVIWVDVTAEKPVRQDMILKVENVQLIGRVTAKDSSGFPRDYDLSQYPLELELSQGKKKETWSTESVSANGTTFSMEMAPGDYTIRLAGQYRKAGYTLNDAKDNALTLTLPMGKPTTHDLSISVSDQKLSGTVYACTRDGDRVDCDFGEGNPLLLKFLDADGNEVASWETASIGKRGAGYSLMLPPGTYTVAAATKDGAAMGVHSDSDEAFTVTIPLGASAKSDIMLDVKNRDYLGTWSNEITVSGFMGVSAGIKLSLEIEESKISLKMAETADMSALGGLGLGTPPESGDNEETYEGTWSETDDGIAMDFSDGKVYFTRLNDDQLYLDLDRLEQDTAAQGSANAYLLELLRTLSYMDVGSMMGMFGGFDMEFGFNMNDMMGVDSMDDIFVFTREK